jgi:acetyl-CoA carboxylase biotin carboxyl carrier protein
MNIDEIKELIRAVNESDVAELKVRSGEDSITIRRAGGRSAPQFVMPGPQPTFLTAASHPGFSAQHMAAPAPVEAPAQLHATVAPAEEEQGVPVKSPIVGTYYDSPSPGSPSFVKVGDRVEPRQVLCIIESMKLMNEIEAEMAGTVIAKLVEDGRPVEYGQALFTIRPH